MPRIFDGNGFAGSMEKSIKKRLEELGNPSLHLHSIFIGDNVGSKIYIGMKKRSLERIGGRLTVHKFSVDADEREVLDTISGLGHDDDAHGIMVELPLPDGWDMSRIASAIDEYKDIDVQNPLNVGRILQGRPLFIPPTPMAVMKILEESGIEMKGSEACIINHSPSIGRPLAMLMLNENATVHVCHVFTRDTGRHSRESDIVVSAAGVPGLIGADMVKEGAVVIDVGMNRVNGKVTGDVDFDAVREKASFITPVPGGVGPVTRYTLIGNLLRAYEMSL